MARLRETERQTKINAGDRNDEAVGAGKRDPAVRGRDYPRIYLVCVKLYSKMLST